MGEWRALPEELEPDVRTLVHRLREMKDDSRLSLAALAGQTPFSKSAWERYLNGKKLPPREAVEALGRLAGRDIAPLTALWELAEQSWNRPRPPSPEADSRGESAAEAVEPTDRAVRRIPMGARLAGAFLVVAAVAAGVAAVSAAGGDETVRPHRASGTAATSTNGTEAGLDTQCFADGCAGLDPKDTGCSGNAWTSALVRVDGVYVELRYSDACRAAWGRISWGAPGDVAEVAPVHGRHMRERVRYDTDVYTAMVPASDPSEVKACTQLRSGRHGCTRPGGKQHLLEPPEPPVTRPPRNSASPTGS
ncbi:DUF2690 domain-containing protein [Streptomyces sp. NPDC052051]|uniref:helix-turn-helix domain-containing protein n=1 Tax=Streptomyces sp. NPDC052051 TaxID=3154649 RepID=UPI00344864FB